MSELPDLELPREVTLEKMGIRIGQRDPLLAIFNALAVAQSEQVFEDQCAALEDMNYLDIFPMQLAAHQAEVGAVLQVEEFHAGRDDHQLESLKGKITRVFAPGLHLWMPSSLISTRCCVCCVVRLNTLQSSIASAQHRRSCEFDGQSAVQFPVDSICVQPRSVTDCLTGRC